MSFEVLNRFPASLPEPVEVAEDQSLQAVVSRIADLLQTSTPSVVQELSQTSTRRSRITETANNPIGDESSSMHDTEDDKLRESRYSGELSDCIFVCESVWPGVQLQLSALVCAIGNRWRTHAILNIILLRTLTVLEDKTTSIGLRAAILDALFEIFGGERK